MCTKSQTISYVKDIYIYKCMCVYVCSLPELYVIITPFGESKIKENMTFAYVDLRFQIHGDDILKCLLEI